MATSAWYKFNAFSGDLIAGIHDFDAHTFKIALTNATPVAAYVNLLAITQITATGGYTAGGSATTISIDEVAGTTLVNGTEVVFTGTGAGFGPFQYAVLYNDTATGDPLIAWFDYGGEISVAAGDTFTLRFSTSSPGAMFSLV